MTRIALTGATGRLGGTIAAAIDSEPDLELVARLDSTSDPHAMLEADVLIDATRIDASETLVRFAVEHGLNAVVATSGWTAARLSELKAALPAGRGVLVVPNFSVGSVLSDHLATIAGRFFASIEIIEAHHAGKIDSPSGTAVRAAESIAAARTDAGLPEIDPPFGEQRARGDIVAGIPIHSLRLRGVVADQRILFGGTGEVVEIRHETLSADAYREGILLAARAASGLQGLTVGLDSLLGLGAGAAAQR